MFHRLMFEILAAVLRVQVFSDEVVFTVVHTRRIIHCFLVMSLIRAYVEVTHRTFRLEIIRPANFNCCFRVGPTINKREKRLHETSQVRFLQSFRYRKWL
jgi:hypothetical protein